MDDGTYVHVPHRKRRKVRSILASAMTRHAIAHTVTWSALATGRPSSQGTAVLSGGTKAHRERFRAVLFGRLTVGGGTRTRGPVG